MIGIIKQHPAVPKRVQMVCIAVLIKGHEKIRFVTGREHISGAHAYLVDRRSAGNRRGNSHVSHYILVGSTCQFGQESANGLNPVLGISSQTDDNILNEFFFDLNRFCGFG